MARTLEVIVVEHWAFTAEERDYLNDEETEISLEEFKKRLRVEISNNQMYQIAALRREDVTFKDPMTDEEI